MAKYCSRCGGVEYGWTQPGYRHPCPDLPADVKREMRREQRQYWALKKTDDEPGLRGPDHFGHFDDDRGKSDTERWNIMSEEDDATWERWIAEARPGKSGANKSGGGCATAIPSILRLT